MSDLITLLGLLFLGLLAIGVVWVVLLIGVPLLANLYRAITRQ